MRLFPALQRRLERMISRNLDLIFLWVFLIAYLPMVPVFSPLCREDLVPWLMFCLACTVALRGKSYGDGPHVSLTAQHSIVGRIFRWIGMVATPLVMILWYDLGAYIGVSLATNVLHEVYAGPFIQASLYTSGVLVLMLLGSTHGRTAWDPDGVPGWLLWGFYIIFFIGMSFGCGFLYVYSVMETELGNDLVIFSDMAKSLILGLAFLAVGMICGRTKNLRQRVTAGKKDGGKYRTKPFNYLFACLGSFSGLWALAVLQSLLGLGEFSFEQAFIPSAFVIAWAGVVWPKPIPIAMTCLLHEVMPSGGNDPIISTTASPFDEPPEGALRINPLRIKRVRATHPWLVMVKASRVSEFDDPIRTLWPRREPPQAFHSLGDAAFELDPLTKQEQWSEITIRLKGGDDVAAVKGGAAVTQSIVVMKPFLRPGTPRRKQKTTYRWDKPIWEGKIQAVDASTESLSLENGSIIVLSTEGMARAFELEIGAPVYRLYDVADFRPPQLEDYVKV